jgi:hypothetical protein
MWALLVDVRLSSTWRCSTLERRCLSSTRMCSMLGSDQRELEVVRVAHSGVGAELV